MTKMGVLLAGLCALVAGSAGAQDLGPSPVTGFEVASAKVSLPGTRLVINRSPGRIRYSHTGLVTVLCEAFDVSYYQLTSPEWLNVDSFDDEAKYDIEATYRPDTTRDEVRQMLQKLLSERFHLTSHWATKEVSGYILTVDERGPKLKRMGDSLDKARGMTGAGVLGGPMTMDDLAANLTGALSRPVVNQTNIEGRYDIALRWANDDTALDSSWPSLPVAVREQLGLRLSPAKVPLKTLFIDHLDRVPTPN
jgi:uncharacterized protein (TIGR03435 family)